MTPTPTPTPTPTRKFEVSVQVSETFKLDARLCELIGCELTDSDETVIECLETFIDDNIADFATDNYAGVDIIPLAPQDDPDATDTTEATET